MDVIRVVDRFGDPEPAALVPRHRDRLHDVRLRGEQLETEARRHLDARHRGRGGERLLQLERRVATLVVRDVARLLIGERRHLVALPLPAYAVADRPEDAVAHERLESLLVPRALVVAVSRIEHAALPLVAHPGPGLALATLDTLLEHDAVGVVVLVDVRLVPRLERRETLHHRVLGTHRDGGERSGAVTVKLPAH